MSEKEKQVSDLLYEARKAAEENAENKEMLSLEQENKNNEEEHRRLVNEAAIFERLSKQLFDLKKKLNHSDMLCEWNDKYIISDDSSIENRIAELKKAAKVLNELREEIKERELQIGKDCETLEIKIKTLESGVMCYPDEAVLVRDSINNALAEQSKKADAKLLCELLYMTDNNWQDAVESYLNTQRFNIIVSPDNYTIAKKVFISLGDSVKRIGLVDTRKIRETDQADNEIRYLSNMVRMSLNNI